MMFGAGNQYKILNYDFCDYKTSILRNGFQEVIYQRTLAIEMKDENDLKYGGK